MPNTYTLIASNLITSNTASVTFSAIPATYTDLVLRFTSRTTNATTFDSLALKFNSDTSSIYSETNLYGSGSSVGSDRGLGANSTQFALLGASTGNTSTSNSFASIEIYIPNYTSTVSKAQSAVWSKPENSSSNHEVYAVAALYRNTSAISSINLTSRNSENFVSGCSFYLYGIKNS
jgi:hypothetical protein